MGFILPLLVVLTLSVSAVEVSFSAVAQDVEADVQAIERWLDGGGTAQSHFRTWPMSMAAASVASAASSNGGLLVDKHIAAGVACESCHATGEVGGNEGQPAGPTSFDTLCVACHGTMLEVPEGEEMSFPNPHISPHLAPDEVPVCTECHRVHEPGEVTCNLCHRSFDLTMD